MNAFCPLWYDGRSWSAAVSGGLTTAAATAPVAALVSVLLVVSVVGEGDLHLDRLARVGVGQGVGGLSVAPLISASSASH